MFNLNSFRHPHQPQNSKLSKRGLCPLLFLPKYPTSGTSLGARSQRNFRFGHGEWLAICYGSLYARNTSQRSAELIFVKHGGQRVDEYREQSWNVGGPVRNVTTRRQMIGLPTRDTPSSPLRRIDHGFSTLLTLDFRNFHWKPHGENQRREWIGVGG